MCIYLAVAYDDVPLTTIVCVLSVYVQGYKSLLLKQIWGQIHLNVFKHLNTNTFKCKCI